MCCDSRYKAVCDGMDVVFFHTTRFVGRFMPAGCDTSSVARTLRRASSVGCIQLDVPLLSVVYS